MFFWKWVNYYLSALSFDQLFASYKNCIKILRWQPFKLQFVCFYTCVLSGIISSLCDELPKKKTKLAWDSYRTRAAMVWILLYSVTNNEINKYTTLQHANERKRKRPAEINKYTTLTKEKDQLA